MITIQNGEPRSTTSPDTIRSKPRLMNRLVLDSESPLTVMTGTPAISRTRTRCVITSKSPDEILTSTPTSRSSAIIRASMSWSKADDTMITVSI